MNLGTMLISGGTGSLGQAIVTEALKQDVTAIRIFSRNEYWQWMMRKKFKDSRLRFFIGDVRDKDRLTRAMHRVDYVIHAAALKRVEACQYNPMEAYNTNVGGSENVIDAAIDSNVKKVLAISSDKAVAPANVYGATKLAMEYLFKNAGVYGATKFACLRSGNFLESHGNVFEIWEEQAKTGELTLTSKDMRRYFIPIEQVAKLSITLLEKMNGGEIFVPKMQEYSMYDLLRKQYPNCKIKVIGEGEGEKESESLFTDSEYKRIFDYGDYYLIRNYEEVKS